MVEPQPSKLMARVRFPSPAPALILRVAEWRPEVRWFLWSFLQYLIRPCGSVAEHSLGKGEVAGPIPAMGTKFQFQVRVSTHLNRFQEHSSWRRANLSGPSHT